MANRWVFYGGFGAHLETLDIVDLLDGAVVLARPEIADKTQILAVRLVRHAVVNAQCASFQVQQGRGFVVQILAFVAFPLQEAVRAIVGNVHDFHQTAASAVFGFTQQETDNNCLKLLLFCYHCFHYASYRAARPTLPGMRDSKLPRFAYCA